MRMKKHRKIRKSGLSIRTKLIGSFALAATIMFVVNGWIYYNINQMMGRVEDVYVENVALNNLITELTYVQNAMVEYLNTKSSDSMEEYYRSEQNLRNSLELLNTKPTDQPIRLMEKDIYYISNTYLNNTNLTIQYKRGRLIEKYKVTYKKSTEIYDYLNTYLYSLNNTQFLVNTETYSELLASFHSLEVISITILAGICFLMLVIIISLTQNFTYPLTQLAKAANEVASGKLDAKLPTVSSNDEVGVMSYAFNQMICSIRDYIDKFRESMEKESEMKEKELRMEAHLKDAKFQYLQAQIQPHFLFNTLNAGAQLAMMEEADRTYDYIQNVASFYRYNIKKGNEMTSIREELDLIDNYIYIMNVRYSGDIHYDKIVNETVLSEQIPRMVLQPIVENAVKYGIQQVEYPGEIRLIVQGEEDHIFIMVEDNGIGMSKEQIERVIGKDYITEETKNDSNGVGLNNVMNRLSLYYNKEDVLQIRSDGKNQGTKVSMMIPKEKKDDV